MRFRLTVDFDIDLNGVDKWIIMDKIMAIPNFAYAEGLITGDTEAEVDKFAAKVAIKGEGEL